MAEVSIIVPCYNCEQTIEKCIKSIKNQSFKNFEVLLIDDGSTDNTSQIIKKNIQQDNRFQYHYKENGGVYDARNYGLEKIKGEYISFIDSDDHVEKDFIKLLLEAIQKNNVKLSACSYKMIFKNNIKFKININPINIELITSSALWNKLFHKSLFQDQNLKFPTGKFYADLAITSKIIFDIGQDYAIVKKPLYNYAQYSNSIIHTSDDRIYQIYDILEDITQYFKTNGRYHELKEKIEFLWIQHVLYATIGRACNHKNFSKKMIKEIIDHVEKKYPNWRENPYINKQQILFKTYINFLKYNQITIIYITIKYFFSYIQKKGAIK